jgi:SAM-dependent methyltransferase
VELDPDVLAHYGHGREQQRLTTVPTLELIRTRVLLERYLPPPPARVLDVGGGAGVHALWLAGRGYEVELIDPVPLHVEQAAAAGLTAALGDAREVDRPDASVDAVLLLGPLYHLVDRADRLRSLHEARRVVRPDGVVLAAAISRYASTFDGYFRGLIDAEGFPAILREDVRTGQHRNPADHPGFFTTAYFHDSEALEAELVSAGLTVHAVLPIEGPLYWAPELSRRLADTTQLQLILEVLEIIERDPQMTNATAHLLAVGGRAR